MFDHFHHFDHFYRRLATRRPTWTDRITDLSFGQVRIASQRSLRGEIAVLVSVMSINNFEVISSLTPASRQEHRYLSQGEERIVLGELV